MICNKVIDKDHIFSKNNGYIVDTNVLLSLYGNKRYSQQINENIKLKNATQYYNRAIDCGCNIYVPAIVISEFTNLFFKERWNELKSVDKARYKDMKRDYRNTKQYEIDSDYIKEVIEKNIFSIAKPISDNFAEMSLDKMFKYDNDDFNDRLIINIANNNNLYVISADFDVKRIKIK